MEYLGGVSDLLDERNLNRASEFTENRAQVFDALCKIIPESHDSTALRNLKPSINVEQVAPPLGLETPLAYN